MAFQKREMNRCPDCQVAASDKHRPGCDVARCKLTGWQALQCEEDHPEEECFGTVWTGQWPGNIECQEFGWYSYFMPNGNPSWRSCTPDYPGAVEDLNRLSMAHAKGELIWDIEKERLVKA